MKIMSFNTQHCLNYVKQKIDFDIMSDTIKLCEADIVGLNEMRSEGESEYFKDQLKILSELTGIKHYHFAQAIFIDGHGPYGNGLLSKIPIISTQTIRVPDPAVRNGEYHYETRCLLKAKLENGLTVLVIHFGRNIEEQINAVNTVMENLEDSKCILMGDFNITPDDPILLPIKQRMTDTACKFTQDLLSFPSPAPQIKIDYIFVTPDINIINADIPEIVASDHRPHTATIELKN